MRAAQTGTRGERRPDGSYQLSPWEIATGWVGGFDDVAVAEDAAARSPLERLEEALLPALERQPCIIAFSGGRDSSALLAVATRLARRVGLPDPIPATHDFTGMEAADETAWQELVISHLRLRTWERIRDPDAFDVLGAHAREGLSRYGVQWPALIHCHEPLYRLASGGGSLVTGQGGDEILGAKRSAIAWYVLKARPRPNLKLARALWSELAPAPVRRWRSRRSDLASPPQPWLTDELSRRFVAQMAHDACDVPLAWDRATVRQLGRRNIAVMRGNYVRLLQPYDVSFHTPFLDAAFVGSFAASGGRRGFISRTAMMRMLFSEVLPDSVLSRQTKGRFGHVAVGQSSRDFVRSWDGSGLETVLGHLYDSVDLDVFRRACLEEVPYFSTQLLLQSAWLASQQRDASHARSTSAG